MFLGGKKMKKNKITPIIMLFILIISSTFAMAEEFLINTDAEVVIDIEQLNFPITRDLDKNKFNIFNYLNALDFTSYDMKSVYLSTTDSDDWKLTRSVGPIGPVTNGRLPNSAWASGGNLCASDEYVAIYALKEWNNYWVIDSSATGNDGYLFVQLWYKLNSYDNINFENYWTKDFNGYFGYSCIEKTDPTPPELYYSYYCNVDTGSVWSSDDSSQSFRCPSTECNKDRPVSNGLITMTYSDKQTTSRLTSDLCHPEPTVVKGCTDPNAENYDPEATQNDGSCIYPPGPVQGCTDPDAINYNPEATQNDGSCEYDERGCTDPNALNYNPQAVIEDGSCDYDTPPSVVRGCTDPDAENYNPQATESDGSCQYPPGTIKGCTSSTAKNYNEQATVDDGSCEWNDGIPLYVYIVGGILLVAVIVVLLLPSKKKK